MGGEERNSKNTKFRTQKAQKLRRRRKKYQEEICNFKSVAQWWIHFLDVDFSLFGISSA
jgi:hypothetical protein